MTIAAIAKILSSVPTVGAPAATGAGAGRCAGAAVVGRPATAGAAGAAAVRGGGAATGAGRGAAAVGAPVGPPGGSVGNLIVGAALGLGGSVMRTVSFLGATLPVVFLPGSAPSGTPGIFGGFGGTSAIKCFLKINCVCRVSNSYSKRKIGLANFTNPISQNCTGENLLPLTAFATARITAVAAATVAPIVGARRAFFARARDVDRD